MARRDNAYSRLVGWLKLGLPLTALALLSTVFMVARTLDPDDALPYAQVDIDELLRDPRLTAPRYSGMTRQGDEIAFTAEAAHTGSAEDTGARAINPRLQLIAPNGETTEVRAAQALVRPNENLMLLKGTVEIETSTGYSLTSDELRAALDHSLLESPGSVAATAPLTQITAQSMTISRESRGSPEVLVFKGGVRLIYHPATAAPDPSAPSQIPPPQTPPADAPALP